MSSDPSPTVEVRDGVTVISLDSQFETITELLLSTLGPQLLDIASNVDPTPTVLDMSHVKFFGSAFIEVLFRVSDRVSKKPGGVFALCGVTEYCREILEVTNLDKYWKIYDDCGQAISGVKS